MHRAETVAPLDLRVQLTGELPPSVRGYVREKITKAISHAHEPVLFGRVRLTRNRDPAVARPVTAQANLDVNGRFVRAQVAAATAREAVDLLEARLRTRLERRALRWETGHSRRLPIPEPRSGQPPAAPAFSARPPEGRTLIRHKRVTLARCTVDEAAAEMEAMDYDFHLFTETGTGQDSVLYHAGPAGYRLAQVTPDRHHLAAHSLPLTVSELPARVMSTVDAMGRLNRSELGFLFFVVDDLDRGSVLYRRYDGHHGLLTSTG